MFGSDIFERKKGASEKVEGGGESRKSLGKAQQETAALESSAIPSFFHLCHRRLSGVDILSSWSPSPGATSKTVRAVLFFAFAFFHREKVASPFPKLGL
ncbi:hypothetical protein RUM43_011753 [Polyplax serrata]|uniref:Uncharacterized protein n=1 Tax=Polyplax serrata TaxID=468196 RepID=A0AAN8PJS0_POLSC